MPFTSHNGAVHGKLSRARLGTILAGDLFVARQRPCGFVMRGMFHGAATPENNMTPNSSGNPLRDYFDGLTSGPGVWKWLHYFEVYHRHLAKFVGRAVTVLEIGVFSGGSLQMWKRYFGERSQLHGVDIQDACRAHEGKGISIHIGDQSDREFWQKFRKTVPSIDVVIDDGSHIAEHQRITCEELLPILNPGGVYICEDIHGRNSFCDHLHRVADQLNAFVPAQAHNELATVATEFQRTFHSFHFYPYVAVIEKMLETPTSFVAPKRGTVWQPLS